MSIGIDDRHYHVDMKIAGRIVLVVFAITLTFVGAARIGILEDSVRTARDALTFINTGAGGDACIAPANHHMESIG